MAQSREELVNWSLQKAEEYFEAARTNLDSGRLYPAAEEIFRCVETCFEALLFYHGVRIIEYPGNQKKFTGRLALQFLIRDTLVAQKRVKPEIYNGYLDIASELHKASYSLGMVFDQKTLESHLRFAEDLITLAKSIAGTPRK